MPYDHSCSRHEREELALEDKMAEKSFKLMFKTRSETLQMMQNVSDPRDWTQQIAFSGRFLSFGKNLVSIQSSSNRHTILQACVQNAGHFTASAEWIR